mmetsp:Transcript_100885/g.300945  ORF Transcript_100885/g.300945 Transcript_100885/m.300945 type:complete len:245 (+) Transcript_100885:57-791(+)
MSAAKPFAAFATAGPSLQNIPLSLAFSNPKCALSCRPKPTLPSIRLPTGCRASQIRLPVVESLAILLGTPAVLILLLQALASKLLRRVREELVHDLLALLLGVCHGILKVARSQPSLCTPYLDRRNALRLPPDVRVPQRVQTPTILLLVESFFRRDLILAVGHGICLPVVDPVVYVWVACCCTDAGLVHLVDVLPPTRGVGRREAGVPVLVRVMGGDLHPHVKAGGAAGATLRLKLHAARAFEP